MEPLFGTVVFNGGTPGGAIIEINGKDINKRLSEIRSIRLSPKKQTIKIKKDNYYSEIKDINVKKGKEYIIDRINLKYHKGYISVKSNPSKAKVVIDDRQEIGRTPIKDYPLRIGKHRIRVDLPLPIGSIEPRYDAFELVEGQHLKFPDFDIDDTKKLHISRIKRYSFLKLVSWMGVGISTGAVAYFSYEAYDYYYNKYDKAESSSAALHYWEMKNQKTKFALYSGGALLVSFIIKCVWGHKQKIEKQNLNRLTLIPSLNYLNHNNVGIGLTYQF